MWNKQFRKALIAAIYQHLFWSGFTKTHVDPNWQQICSEIFKEDQPYSEKELQSTYELFIEKEVYYTNLLQQYVSKWDKTFDIIKACFYCFLIELGERKNEPDLKLVGTYIKFGQDFAGGDNPGLVHAVLSNILENDLEKL